MGGRYDEKLIVAAFGQEEKRERKHIYRAYVTWYPGHAHSTSMRHMTVMMAVGTTLNNNAMSHPTV